MGTIDAILKGANILKEAGKIDEYKQILELLEERSKFLEQISNLKEENQDLKDKLKNKEELSLGINCYLTKDGVHYCMCCYDKNKDRIRLSSRGRGNHLMDCPVCQNTFNVSESEQNSARVFYPGYGNYE